MLYEKSGMSVTASEQPRSWQSRCFNFLIVLNA